MKLPYFTILAAFLLTSCGTHYRYFIDLKGENVKAANHYADKDIDIKFRKYKKYFTIDLINVSDKPIKIIWDDSAIVLDSQSYRIIHENIRYIESMNFQVPSIIPSKMKLKDMIAPTAKLSWDSKSGWYLKELYPTFDRNDSKIRKKILSYKGQHLGILLTYEKEGIKYDRFFDFVISDVKKDGAYLSSEY